MDMKLVLPVMLSSSAEIMAEDVRGRNDKPTP